MTLLLPSMAAPGHRYLVDVGLLVPVAAVSARDAFHMVMSGRYGVATKESPEDHPLVYEIDADGEVLAVYE